MESPVQTPFGSVYLAGLHLFGHGSDDRNRLRTIDSHALVLVTRGGGSYKDGRGTKIQVQQGDLILVKAGAPHWYGPSKNQVWDEIYVCLDGAIFDHWFAYGQPIVRTITENFNSKSEWLLLWIEQLATTKSPRKQREALLALSQFIGEIVSADNQDEWVERAKSALRYNLREDVDLDAVAAELGSNSEAFRKRFQSHTGTSPIKFRNDAKMDAAKHLVRFHNKITNREVAETLGFSDEFHFSKRFKQIVGVTPNEFRSNGK
ncbi:MAG TPA: AraC family transcriptional regulator [Fimbriimonas sp.]|nr:AraC family transcriptional regulator [Fimbriimonas sp.]